MALGKHLQANGGFSTSQAKTQASRRMDKGHWQKPFHNFGDKIILNNSVHQLITNSLFQSDGIENIYKLQLCVHFLLFSKKHILWVKQVSTTNVLIKKKVTSDNC